jgi:hypothetical protein
MPAQELMHIIEVQGGIDPALFSFRSFFAFKRKKSPRIPSSLLIGKRTKYWANHDRRPSMMGPEPVFMNNYLTATLAVMAIVVGIVILAEAALNLLEALLQRKTQRPRNPAAATAATPSATLSPTRSAGRLSNISRRCDACIAPGLAVRRLLDGGSFIGKPVEESIRTQYVGCSVHQ